MFKFYRVDVGSVSHNPTERIGETMLEEAGHRKRVRRSCYSARSYERDVDVGPMTSMDKFFHDLS